MMATADLAAAARPFPGPAGVTLIAIAAVMSASGPINATLCGAAKVRLPDGPRRRPARPVRPARLSVGLPRLMLRRVYLSAVDGPEGLQ